MFSIIVTQLLELRIPSFLILLVFGIEIETNFVEHPFSFRAHCASFEDEPLIVDPDGSLIVDPIAQLRVLRVPPWHFTCNSGREAGEGVRGHSRR
jgi:hypothetical protein